MRYIRSYSHAGFTLSLAGSVYEYGGQYSNTMVSWERLHCNVLMCVCVGGGGGGGLL